MPEGTAKGPAGAPKSKEKEKRNMLGQTAAELARSQRMGQGRPAPGSTPAKAVSRLGELVRGTKNFLFGQSALFRASKK